MSGLNWEACIEDQEKSELALKIENVKISTTTYPTTSGDANTVTVTQNRTTPPTDTQISHEQSKESLPKPEEDSDAAQNAADASMLNKALHDKLQDNAETQLQVQQKDPNSPLYSVKSFEELHLKADLLEGVYAMGFNAPSKIQETALPLLLADPPKNMIAQSQSGTGKTAAFVLTMLSRVDTANRWPQAICLAPTLELAMQIGSVVEEMGAKMKDLKIIFAIRGNKLAKYTKIQDHIVIGTPGTMLDWCTKLKFVDMSKIKVFILDEADVMIATQGHQDQSIRIQRALPKTCQMMLFSATYEESVMQFANKIVADPVVIRLRRDEESLQNIKQYYVMCRSIEEKYQALSNIYGAISIGQAMIFCHTRRTTNWLAEKMSREGHAVGLLSGELDISQRLAVLKRFKEGKEKILITTNVMSRGIDIEQVTIVVNFDLPVDQSGIADCETYLHRIGRTGRFGKSGLAINFLHKQESLITL